MELNKMTNQDLVFLDRNWNTKEEVLDHLIDALDKQGFISDKKAYKQAVLEREQISATGMEAGLAIPHGKSTAVKQAAVAFARVNDHIDDWESIDPTNQVKYIFLLAIPQSEAASTHLQLLAELSKRLMDQQYYKKLINSKDEVEFLKALENGLVMNNDSIEYSRKIVAITACAAGIAHTYMAAEALEKAGRELGIQVTVEKQGANGIEDRITTEELNDAVAVIFATDIAAKEKNRFNGLPYIQRRVAEPLRNATKMIEQALTEPDGIVQEGGGEAKTSKGKQSFLSLLYQGILTGISYMIPIIVAAGLMIGIGQLGASAFGLEKEIGDVKYATDTNQIIMALHFLGLFGSMIMKFMYPVFTAYLAYTIADRPGLAPGFIGGAFAAGLHYSLWGVDGGIPSGFFGALILGIIAGFVAKFLNEKIYLHKNLQAMKPMFIIPGVTVLVIFILNFYIIDPVFGALNSGLQQLIINNQGSGTLLLAVIIACLTAFDLGGPVNKAAGAISIGLAADHIFPLTARELAIVIPPIGIGLATILDKYIVKRRVFDENLRVIGTTSLILGFIAIGEGAIPFMLANPIITISINLIGASLGTVTAIILGAVQWYPLPAVWGWPLVENFWAYGVGIIVGVLFIALANIFVRFALIKRKEAKEV
ncbi:PTS transporter subunit EIIA [Peribacillus muralis]|uniref:fructose-specific PTS transporter subunit EIIC n=1 Tax=Peribacillus muralis TaxID=264697 RepID=UPI001F4D60BE|nr:fructose-specific PTS transporter subunit EIIC [Peribacillus muralis]MCK1993816.1 fructose-specific PTS transporter subunit EIIC [Peribacillus muralis]MCK2013895.1 fructose-specific PTS transporter subunit EIIC [Peribacillus muralis]